MRSDAGARTEAVKTAGMVRAERGVRVKQIVRSVVNLPQLPDDRLYDYLIPPDWEDIPIPGMRLLVPFGRQRAEAFVWGIVQESNIPVLREIIDVLDEEPLLCEEQRKLIDWMAEKFFCRRLDLLRLFLPPGLKAATEKCWKLLSERHEVEDYLHGLSLPEQLRDSFKQKLAFLIPQYHKVPNLDRQEHRILSKLVRAGLVGTWWLPKKQEIKDKTVKAYGLKEIDPEQSGISLTPKQEMVYKYVREGKGEIPASKVLSDTGVSVSVLETLCRKGILKKSLLNVERDPFCNQPTIVLPPPKLSMEQEKALNLIIKSLQKNETKTFLLHGVTGSGKTEVYLRAIEETIKKGKKAIYLVPEISLTPQTVQRVRSRFGDDVAILHSSLSDGERFDQWWKIRRGGVKVVVGARSALFAPLTDLGLIIMDEEHEYTYKQEETPRYHAREVAKEICQMTGSLLILGSATPSLESYYLAETEEIEKLSLSKRILGRTLPEIRLVDLREEFKAKRFSVLSPPLRSGIEEALSRGEQVILLLNRRGYATFINCRECGHVIKCPSCDVTLTYHQRPNLLRCHYCDYKEKPPDTCPRCRSHYIRYFGKGTQRLEEELNQLFPQARTIRMDLDTTGRKGSHEKIYHQLVKGEVDILIGTQMVAKGLDLPQVTLVGVIAADTALGLPDFRSAERTYQILTQAAGRAGRGEKPGLVYIQTFNPEHYSITALKRHDEFEFYNKELIYRQTGGYPPFTKLVRLVFSGGEQKAVIKAAVEVTKNVKIALENETTCTRAMNLISNVGQEKGITIIGPNPAAIERVQNRYRWQTLIKTKELSVFYRLLPKIISDFLIRNNRNVRIIIDENPFSML